MLLFAVGLVALSVAQLAYRFALPTDGWAVLTTDTFGATDWTYWENLVGAPSELRRGDLLIAVDGRSVRGVAGAGYLSPPPGWGAEQIVALRIARQGQELTVPVPVVHWTCAALWRHLLIRPDLLVGLLGGLACFALALFTVRQRPEVPAARALLVLSAAFLASDVSVLLPDGLSVQFDQPAVYTTAFFSYLIFGVLLAPALLAFTLLFPRPKRLIQRHPRLGLVPFGVGLLVGALVLGGRSPWSAGWRRGSWSSDRWSASSTPA